MTAARCARIAGRAASGSLARSASTILACSCTTGDRETQLLALSGKAADIGARADPDFDGPLYFQRNQRFP